RRPRGYHRARAEATPVRQNEKVGIGHGRIESINASRAGVPKTNAFETLITEHGIDGDQQRDSRYDRGPDRAVVLFSLDVIRALQREGHPIGVGTTRENL